MLTNFKKLDKLINGFKNGELITIASRPAIGKSSFVISILNKISDKKILYYNLEESASSLEKSIVNKNVEIIAEKKYLENIKENLNNDVSLIVIDCIQLLSSLNNEDIASCLKNLALELNIPIVVVSELSREVQGRPGKDSLKYKNLASLSDKIIYLYRDSYYHKSDSQEVEVIVSKNNNGKLGTIKLIFDREKREFRELNE